MKKLSLFLALALVLSFNVFADENKNHKKMDLNFIGKCFYDKDYCSRLEITEDEAILFDGNKVEHAPCLSSCMTYGKIKGTDKAMMKRKQKENEYRKNAPLRPEMKFKLDSLKKEQNKNKPRK
jgi:hypothetical protein